MSENMFPITSWWFRHRLEYNKALLFTGLMGFAIQAALYPLKIEPYKISKDLIPKMQFAGELFILFLILANIAFTLGSIADFLIPYPNKELFRVRVFQVGYWFAISSLILSIIIFLGFI